jgi:hypothetical protein
MKPEEEDWDEARYSSLLHSTDHDMPPPDPDFLARLRERSTRAFLEAAAQGETSARDPAAVAFPAVPTATPAPATLPSPGRRSMLSIALKAVSTCAAAAVVIGAGLIGVDG